jgi:hypothetical protein
MTSGQSGPYGEPGRQPGPEGPPQGWNPPPPQQGWSPPPQQQGWNPPPQEPYGQQYPGYGPEPSAPTGYGAPTAMERPTTVRAGIGAFIANLVLGVIGAALTFGDMDAVIAQAVAASGDPQLTEDAVRSIVVLSAVFALLIYALIAMFIAFAWKGRNWARIVLWVLGGLSVLVWLSGTASAGSAGQTGFMTALAFCQLVLVVAGIVLLALKPSNDWYRFRAWQRANGRR